MKKILDEFNIFKIIKEDVKKFPITMIIVVMLTLSVFGWFIAPAANDNSEMFYTIYSILSRLVIILPIIWLIVFIIEYNIKSKGKGSIKNALPYSSFVIVKVLILLLFCFLSNVNNQNLKEDKLITIFFSFEILWVGIYNIPKIMYKIGIQERKEEKMIITLLKSFLAGAIGYIYALMVSMLVSYIISYIIFVFI